MHLEQSNEGRMNGTCSTPSGNERCIQILVGKREGKSPHGRIVDERKINININMQDLRFHGDND
jgi:hypothetical protein